MNRITINKDIVTELDETIDVNLDECHEFFGVCKIVITPICDTKLEIVYNVSEFKADIIINLGENINFELFELRESDNVKVKYEYNLDRMSNLKVSKFYDASKVREFDKVNLNGEGAYVEYILKTIASDKQDYNLTLCHNAKGTISKVINSGVNVTGSINFNVEGIVPNGISGCELNQNNRIITFNDNVCRIDPIFLIDENDVVADHAALIGRFSDEELFYLKSRGIDHNNAIKLLVKGFLLDGIDDDRLDNIIKKYWR
jgi:Fe-S cluster assembly protein SufD